MPWGISFPHGVPPTLERVHPTQLYEALLLAGLVALFGRWRRRGVSDAQILAAYLGLAGAGRFAIEFLRLNARVALGFSVAQWASLLLVLASAVLAARQRSAAADSRRSVPPATRGVR